MEALYNESQIRTRNVIERSFGILKRRFPVLTRGMAISTRVVQSVIIACVVLHNIAVDENEPAPPVVIPDFERMLADTTIEAEPHIEPQQSRNNVRSRFLSTYFPALLRRVHVNELGDAE